MPLPLLPAPFQSRIDDIDQLSNLRVAGSSSGRQSKHYRGNQDNGAHEVSRFLSFPTMSIIMIMNRAPCERQPVIHVSLNGLNVPQIICTHPYHEKPLPRLSIPSREGLTRPGLVPTVVCYIYNGFCIVSATKGDLSTLMGFRH